MINRSILQNYFGGRNEGRETDLVQSRKQKEEWFSDDDDSADANEHSDV
ncbi:MAG: hypothetical protein VXA14_00105 [Euryarchaeota archaeon]